MFPYGILLSGGRIWRPWLSTFLLTLLFLWVCTSKIRRACGIGRAGGSGGEWRLWSASSSGRAAFSGLWILYRRHQKGLRSIPHVTIASLFFIAVVSPWFVRNYVVFHRFIPFRDNMGIVLLTALWKHRLWARMSLARATTIMNGRIQAPGRTGIHATEKQYSP